MKKPTYEEFYNAVVEGYKKSYSIPGEDCEKAIKENEDFIQSGYKEFISGIEDGDAKRLGWTLKGRAAVCSYNLYMWI